MSEIICDICPHHCHIQEGKTGMCRARMNRHGINACANYGRITSLAMDPIEKKPFADFYPGSMILSVGSYGCNLACPFCQNAMISMADEETADYREISPDQLAKIILSQRENLGIAFTYNEPMISWEYIRDTAQLLKGTDKKVVLVTNGCVSQNVLKELMPYTDAMNIDLKGNAEFYHELKGEYQTVKDTIAYCYDQCHVEVTSLIIPGKNDSIAFIEAEAKWLASLDPSIVLHISRYFPRYQYQIKATDPDTIRSLCMTAEKYLMHVYPGNI
jgi:pyruvate formate lyase activating enzyme